MSGHRRLLAAAILLPVIAPAPAHAQDWTGFYMGGFIGAANGQYDSRTSAIAGTGAGAIPASDLAAINGISVTSDGQTVFTGGLEVSGISQLDALLIGFATDISVFDLNRNVSSTVRSIANPAVSYTLSQNLHTNALWTFRPRFGYVGGNWIIYATGGLAMTGIKYSTNYSDTSPRFGNANMAVSTTETGWTAGWGAAYEFAPHWSLKGEWLYADFGHVHGTSTAANGTIAFDSEAEIHANFLRIGIDYRF